MVGNLTKKKCQMPGGQPGGGAWAPLDLTHEYISGNPGGGQSIQFLVGTIFVVKTSD